MSFKIRAAAVITATSLVAVPLALSGTALAQDDQPATGHIGGIVFNDFNGDGVKQDHEPGLVDVNVTVKGPDGNSEPSSTNNYGVWTVKRAALGKYEVSYVDPKLGNTTPATVQAEITATDSPSVSFGVRGGSICGVAWHDKNEDGKRQAGEGPLAERSMSVTGNGISELTGADGSYCFTGLVPGEYQVHASRKTHDTVTLTKPGGDSKFDWMSGLTQTIRVGKGEQVKGIDAGFMPARADLKAVQLLINNSGGVTDQDTFKVGDEIEIYGSVVANGNTPEFLGGVLTLPEGLRIVAPAGGLGKDAAVVGQKVHASFGDRKPVGLIEFLGAKVVVEKEFTGGEIKWEVEGLYADTNPGNNVLTRKINAVGGPAVQPEQNHGPAVVDTEVKKTAGLANTGADPVAAGAIGLGALALGGLALFAARRRKNA
ncbi:LPXTG cell wall anchor domain-containing protein [Lentzea alba]|uniref:SdrD B-like domain-containing protein n=1 Tax=Lentzea alba TaxID=2714351 RepID=UPI0039BF2429